jgi:hypothetical protein
MTTSLTHFIFLLLYAKLVDGKNIVQTYIIEFEFRISYVFDGKVKMS